jgi:hypothetical protein
MNPSNSVLKMNSVYPLKRPRSLERTHLIGFLHSIEHFNLWGTEEELVFWQRIRAYARTFDLSQEVQLWIQQKPKDFSPASHEIEGWAKQLPD